MVVNLAEVVRRSDEAVRHARAELVHAVREAARQGLAQAQIAALIGRSQPEVSRLLRFHGRGQLRRGRHPVTRTPEESLREAQHFALMRHHAEGDLGDQLVIDAICMRLSAGLEALARRGVP